MRVYSETSNEMRVKAISFVSPLLVLICYSTGVLAEKTYENFKNIKVGHV